MISICYLKIRYFPEARLKYRHRLHAHVINPPKSEPIHFWGMTVKHLLGFTALFLTLVSACGTSVTPTSNLNYTAADSRRALMVFDTAVEFQLPDGYSGDVTKLMTSRWARSAREQVDRQIAHLFSALAMHPRYINNPGAPRNNPTLKYGRVERMKNNPNKALIHYRYQDVVIFKTKIVAEGAQRDITFLLPKDPSTIYAAGVLKRGTINHCTDAHYNTEDDHWYFWNPFLEKCPYKSQLRDYAIGVTAHLKALPSKTKSFPEYDLLNRDGKLTITYLTGIESSFAKTDYGRQNYEEALKTLTTTLGFSVISQPDRWSRKLERRSNGQVITINMSFRNQESEAFIQDAADGMRKSDVFIYNGHSGLGGFLSLERFHDEISRRFQIPKDKYQIFFFNGCSSYSYYNKEFIDMKRSPADRAADPENLKDKSKYLDIVTNGIESSFALGINSDLALIRAVVQGKRPSWQDIIQEMYDTDHELSALTMVNGDGDNPRTPGRR